METFQFALPYPPSVNHYWRKWRGKMVISQSGRDYRRDVVNAIETQYQDVVRFDCPVIVLMVMHPPDRRKRDIDNIEKAVYDSLKHCGVIKDDSLIIQQFVVKSNPVTGGRLYLTIVPAKGFGGNDA